MRYLIPALFFLIFVTNIVLGDEKGIIEKEIEDPLLQIDEDFETEHINNIDTFKNVILQNTSVIMFANYKYEPASGYQSLNYPASDIKLLRQLLMQCCKVKEENIFSYENTTISQFKSCLKDFISNLEKDSRVIIYYTGHGNVDGSIVFPDSNKLEPKELRNIINSFSNDTILFIDACYSGRYEGVKEFIPESEEPFRKGSIRIYSSLAHLTAKEIEYKDNPFLKDTALFHKQILGMEDIEGNGYFTALIGRFFAKYRFQKGENVTFKDLFSYISNKAKLYEQALILKVKNDKSFIGELYKRSEQYPKYEPVDQKVEFKNPDHQYIVLQQTTNIYQPEKNYLSYEGSAVLSWPITCTESQKQGFMQLDSFHYNFYFSWGIIGTGLACGVQWNTSKGSGIDSFNFLLYPIAVDTRYNIDFGIFFFQMHISAGVGINQLFFIESTERDSIGPKFYLNTGLGLGVNPWEKTGLAAKLDYILLIPYEENYMILLPGIELVKKF